MKKILLSAASILFAGAVIAGGTGAFLADSETSTGNTFATGVVDLKVDNESYVTDNEGDLVASPATSWGLSSLAGKLFFNFLDLKPGDIGEDTISLHINNNNAWLCMNVNITGTPENGQTGPEDLIDPTGGDNDGELQNHLYFSFWVDDGDNVYEKNEFTFKKGLAKDIFNGKNWTLADSVTNIWGHPTQYIPGGVTKYIAKAWCFGDLTATPLDQDGKGKNGNNGPLARGTGFTCNGVDVGNIVQSDGIKADVSFTAVQARNNKNFKCSNGHGHVPPPQTLATLFSDNFENYEKNKQIDYNYNYENWDESGGVHVQWGDNSSKVGDLNGDSTPSQIEILTTKTINATGYNTITLKYDRKTDDIDSPPVGPQTLTVEYSVNGGSSWTTLETVVGESGWTGKTFSLSPAADNKPNIKVRFKLDAQNASNHAYVDNVIVTGVSI